MFLGLAVVGSYLGCLSVYFMNENGIRVEKYCVCYNNFMDKAQSYNIITGEIKKEYPMNSTSLRFGSLTEIKRAKENGQYKMPIAKIRRLGTSSDSKSYIYGHETTTKLQTQPSPSLPEAQRTSLINASKLVYNPINLTTSSANPRWNNAFKLGPLSREAHLGRLNAPNYSKDFADKLANNATDFHRKKSACTELCHIQKSYGVEKLFRKYK